jgi:hypothetical protein
VTAENLKSLAEELLENLLEDVEKCSTREAHIRATARANEAQHLLIGINQMFYDGEEETNVVQEETQPG